MLNILPNQHNYKQGQATLLAILILTAIAVVTAVGVATRQQSGVRRTTYTSQTDQAFSCANSAIDLALQCIKSAEEDGDDPTVECANESGSLDDNSATEVCSYNYVVSELSETEITITKLPKDTVQQFIITGVDPSGINIEFSKFNTSGNDVGLEVTHAVKTGSNYTMDKYTWYCGVIPNPGDIQGFDPLSQDISTGVCSPANITPAGGDDEIIRIRPYFGDASVKVSNLPTGQSQGYLVVANGNAGTVQRNIEVMRMNPQLPALFDYVLYSEEGSITK